MTLFKVVENIPSPSSTLLTSLIAWKLFLISKGCAINNPTSNVRCSDPNPCYPAGHLIVLSHPNFPLESFRFPAHLQLLQLKGTN